VRVNDDLLRRIDRQLERGNELMQRNEHAFDGLRDFVREMVIRFERVDARSEARHERMIERMDRLTEIVIDHRDEGRAQTRALLQVLDRLEGSGPAPAA
jgi:hypothetical protein